MCLLGRMKGVPEEEEDEEAEVWSSRTTPPPKIPCYDEGQALADETYWDPEDYAGIPSPPDGGWGWVIVFASFMCNTVVDGIAYSFGIFLIHFVRHYNSNKGETAWVGSLLTGCYLSAGPLVSALTNKFGCRPVTMAGGVIAALAFLLSTIAPSVRVLMFTYGILGGIGFGLIYLPAIVSVGYYFSTKRAFATGIAVCGSGMGAFVFAPVTQFLLDHYDWKGALVILAGLSLNCTVFGALMRPLEPVPSPYKLPPELKADLKRTPVTKDKADSGLVSLLSEDPNANTPMLNTEPGVQSTLNLAEVAAKLSELPLLSPMATDDFHNSVDVVPAVGVIVTSESSTQPLSTVTHLSHKTPRISIQPLEEMQNSSLGTLGEDKTATPSNGGIKLFRSQGNVKDMLQRRFTLPAAMPASANVLCPTANNNYMVQRNSVGRGGSWSVHGGAARRRKVSDRKDLARPLYRKDIFYSGSIMHLTQFHNSRHDVRSYVASVTSIPHTESPAEPDYCEKKEILCGGSKCIKLPKSMVDTLKEILDFSLLREPPFLLACIANVFGMMGFYIPFVYITDSSIMKGISRDYAAFLISIIGIANLIGRLLFGWLVDRPRVRALDVNNLCLTISGLATIVIPFCYSYTAIVAASTVFSVFVSAYISLTSIILVDMVGLDRLTNSFGLLSLFRGAASIIGPPIAGTVYDLTGSYDIPFFIAGGLLMTSALLTFFVPWLTRCSLKRNAEQPVNPLPPFSPEYSVTSDTDSGRPESIAIADSITVV